MFVGILYVISGEPSYGRHSVGVRANSLCFEDCGNDFLGGRSTAGVGSAEKNHKQHM